MDYFEGMVERLLLQTEFFPTNDLNDCGAISIHQVMESLNMRESILRPETGLQRSQIGRKGDQVIVQSTDLSKPTQTVYSERVLG